MTDQRQFTKEFELAKKVIKDAGEITLSYFDRHPKITKIKNGYSIVTEADEASESFIRNALSSSFPSYGFIGEETEEENKETSWVVDPIDGTSAFARGIPEYGIAIALKAGSNLVFSLQYLPLKHELYHAIKGQGAYYNDSHIFVSKTDSLQEGLLSFDSTNIRKRHYTTPIKNLLNEYRFRVGHSSVVESIYLAKGKIELLAKFEQAIWDAAPACLLMEEAGAIIRDPSGNAINFTFSKSARQSYIATNASLIKQEMAMLYETN